MRKWRRGAPFARGSFWACQWSLHRYRRNAVEAADTIARYCRRLASSRGNARRALAQNWLCARCTSRGFVERSDEPRVGVGSRDPSPRASVPREARGDPGSAGLPVISSRRAAIFRCTAERDAGVKLLGPPRSSEGHYDYPGGLGCTSLQRHGRDAVCRINPRPPLS